MIEETSGPTPFCVVGDMNAELPVEATCNRTGTNRDRSIVNLCFYMILCTIMNFLSVMENVTSTILHTPKEPSQAI